MNRQQTDAEFDGIDEGAVADYLRAHPDFFTRHRRLAADLTVPHDVAPAISLVEYQMRLLREEKQRLRWRLDDLLRVARENDRVAEQLHRLTLELLETNGLEGALVTLRDGLRADFRADVVSVRLVGKGLPEVSVEVLPETHPDVTAFGEQFRGHRPVVGRLTSEQMRLAFGEQGGDIRSAAVIPFTDGGLKGIVGIGSFDGDRYGGDQGTVFLCRLGELVARMLRCAADGADG